MELLLDKKRFDYMKCVASGSTIHEESTEVIVSDRSPDIARIVRGIGNVFVAEKEARDGKVYSGGTIRGVVLYVADGEKCLRKLEVTIPFYHTFEANGVTPDSKVVVSANLRAFEVREINPRKVAVRASVDVSFRAYENAEKVLYEGIVGADEFGVCTRKVALHSYDPIIIKEKNFSISDDIELTGEAMEMSELLICDVCLAPRETKIIGNKSILKGVVDLSYVYETESGMVYCDERELPFSQILDIEGMDESHELEVSLSVLGYEFDPQYDAGGKARYMTVSITAEAVAKVYSMSECEILEDGYSTRFEVNVKRDNLTGEKYIERSEKRVPTTVSIETGCGVKRVLDVAVALLPPVRRREEGREIVSSDAQISVMYIGEDDDIFSVSRRASVICPTEISENHNYEVTAFARGRSFSVGGGNDINVRFFTDFAITETERESVLGISEMSVDTEKVKDEKRPAITIIRTSHECDVWSLAKKFGGDVDEICMVNEISEDEKIRAGRRILIPKGR